MKTYFLPLIEKYLRKEGFSYLLPETKNTVFFSYMLVLIILLTNAAITYFFQSTFWLGFLVSFTLIFIYLILVVSFFSVREIPKILKNKSKYNPALVMSEKDSKFTGTSIIVWLLFAPSLVLGFMEKSWLLAVSDTVVTFFVILLWVYVINNPYWILAVLEMLFQFFKGWATSWRSVLSITPLLLVTILFSLFSGDMWILLGKMSTSELSVLIFLVYIPVFFAMFARFDLTDLIVHSQLSNEENLVSCVFAIPYFRELKKVDFLSIEDQDDLLFALKWRDLTQSKEIVAKRLERRIQSWYLLLIMLTSAILWFSFFVVLFLFFTYISPSLSQMGWSTGSNLPNITTSIPQVTAFLASLQTAAFAASLLDKPKDNVLFKQVIEKSTDWLAVILVYQAAYTPFIQVWELKEEAPWHKKFGVTTLRGKLIAHENASDDEIQMSCEKLELLYPRFQLIDFNIFRNNQKLFENLRFGIEDFQWKYIHNRKFNKKQFNSIHSTSEIQEQHTLGREKLLAGQEIPLEWFGTDKRSSEIGVEIWELDKTHELIMHPCVYGTGDKNLLISICLFRKLQKSSEYSDLAHKILALVQEKNPSAKNILIHFHFRSAINKVIAELTWIEGGFLTYKDELKKENKILKSIFSLFYRVKSQRKVKKKK